VPDEPPSLDPWEAARARARADVATAWAPRPRTCPSCGREEITARRTCEHCGASYVQVRPSRRPSRRGWALIATGLAALTVAAVVLIPILHRATIRDEHRQASEHARLVAATRRGLLADQRPRLGHMAPGARPAMVRRVERAITRDANRRLRAGRLTGRPVRGTSCAPYPPTAARRAAEADPATRRARYECVAFNSRVPFPRLEGKPRTGLFGYPFYAVIAYRSGAYAFCKITPKVGEGGSTLVDVVVPPACRA
jgi:hypothetical protein